MTDTQPRDNHPTTFGTPGWVEIPGGPGEEDQRKFQFWILVFRNTFREGERIVCNGLSPHYDSTGQVMIVPLQGTDEQGNTTLTERYYSVDALMYWEHVFMDVEPSNFWGGDRPPTPI